MSSRGFAGVALWALILIAAALFGVAAYLRIAGDYYAVPTIVRAAFLAIMIPGVFAAGWKAGDALILKILKKRDGRDG